MNLAKPNFFVFMTKQQLNFIYLFKLQTSAIHSLLGIELVMEKNALHFKHYLVFIYGLLGYLTIQIT